MASQAIRVIEEGLWGLEMRVSRTDRMNRMLLVALSFLAAASATSAEETQPFGLMPDEKIASCAGFAARSPVQQDVAAGWVTGFIGGANAADPQQAAGADPNASRSAIRTWLRAWCTQFPLESISSAAKEYRRELLEAGAP
jgi:hypothetical protein